MITSNDLNNPFSKVKSAVSSCKKHH